MAFKLVTGPRLNHWSRAVTPPSMSPAALTRFPAANAWDNRSSKPAMFGTAQDESTYGGYIGMVPGGFEDADEAANWTMLGVGGISSNNGDAYSGTASGLLSMDGGAIEVAAYYDVAVRAGETLNIFGAVKKGSATDARIRIRNRVTGKWLKGDDQTWSVGLENVFSVSGSGWETVSGSTAPITFTVENLATCQADEVLLRIYLYGDGGSPRFDQIELWPSVDWLSVHGHNISPFVVPTLQHSDNGSSWTTETVVTLRRDSFYVALDDLESHRYWRVLFDGHPDTGSLMYVGEIILAQHFDLIHNPRFGGSCEWIERQTRLATDLGEEFASRHNVKGPYRRLLLPFGFSTDQEYEQFRDPIFRGSRGGTTPMVIAPVEMDSSVVLFGRCGETSVIDKTGPYPRTGELEVVELPLPSMTDLVYAYDVPIEEEE